MLTLITSDGEPFPLDFEPILTLEKDPRNYIDIIVADFNTKRATRWIRDGDVVVDLGANIGLFTCCAAPLASRVIAVEPSLRHYQNLVKVCEQAPAGAYIETVRAAIWTEDGEIPFMVDKSNHTMDRISYHADNPHKDTVKCTTLATLFDKYDIEYADFVKMDIEGAEIDVLRGEGFTSVVDRIGSIWVECHNYKDWGDGMKVAEDVRAELLKHFSEIFDFNICWMYAHD